MRLRHFLLLPPLALVLVPVVFGGCNKEEELDNLCLFLKDEDSCYRNFLADAMPSATPRCAMDTLVGTFDLPNVLERCTVTGASVPADAVTQVQFDPPIEMNKLPYTGGNVKLLINGTQCGTIDFGPNEKVAVALDVYPQLTDPEAPCATSDTQFCGSSFSNTPIVPESASESSTVMTTKCGDGSTFTFDRFQVEQQCADQAQFVPNAKMLLMPNGVDKKGLLQLSIQYSPTQTAMYVNCEIPGQLAPCANGVKDGVETDVDCGGSVCTGRCAADQGCISDSDCGPMLVCKVVAGLKKCG